MAAKKTSKTKRAEVSQILKLAKDDNKKAFAELSFREDGQLFSITQSRILDAMRTASAIMEDDGLANWLSAYVSGAVAGGTRKSKYQPGDPGEGKITKNGTIAVPAGKYFFPLLPTSEAAGKKIILKFLEDTQGKRSILMTAE